MNRFLEILIICLFCTAYIESYGQVELLTPIQTGNDTVWYSNISEDNLPDPQSCELGQNRFFRYKFTKVTKVEDDIKSDTIKTDKTSWEEEDEDSFDEKYNEEKKEELEKMKEDWDDSREDLSHLATETIEDFMENVLNSDDYCICIIDCPEITQICKIYWEITLLKDADVSYKYKTNFSWLVENDEGSNQVEIDFDLYIHYEAWIYFKITCACDESGVLLSLNPDDYNDVTNFWASADLTGEIMKPGHPFVIPIENGFPWLLTGAGALTAGGIIYFATSGENNIQDCSFTLSTDQVSATCDKQNGSASVTPDPSGNYLYEWSTGSTLPDIHNVSPGIYTVTVTDINQQCTKTISVTIENDNDTFMSSLSTLDAQCGLNNGEASLFITPIEKYDIDWSSGQSGNSVSNLSVGTYSVTITTANGCSEILNFDIGERDDHINLTFETEDASCGKADGTALLNVSPEGNYTYLWSNGATDKSVTGLESGTYTVTVYPSNSACEVLGSVTVDVKPLEVDLTFESEPEYCDQSDGSLTIIVTPPGTYEYLWSDGSEGTSLEGISEGVYNVTVSVPGTNCTAVGEGTVEGQSAAFEITFNSESAHCGLEDGSAEAFATPSGNYAYIWSNGESTSVIQNVAPGIYMVTVSDDNGCQQIGQIDIPESPLEFIQEVVTIPGNCVDGGNIILDIENLAEGNVIIDVSGPNGKFIGNFEPGLINLSEFVAISAGNYTITIYDLELGMGCSEIISVDVDDDTPLLDLEDDIYETSQNETISGNLLDNDTGFLPMLVFIGEVNNGTLTFTEDGSFTFHPDTDFIGTVTFTYTVSDGCGNMAEANVIIEVIEVACMFEVSFNKMPASCGYNDGSLEAIVNGTGNYTFVWNNGETGSFLANIEAGNYSVTVMETDAECFLVFDTELSENPADYIANLEVIDPECSVSGDIILQLSSPGGGPFDIVVNTPNGIEVGNVPEGQVNFGDFFTIVPGDYFLSITDLSIGSNCVDNSIVTVGGMAGPIIELVTVFHPSGMTSMDGAIEIGVISPGETPYTIILNGSVWGSSSQEQIFIEGLSAGDYTISLVDANGCTSNELVVSLTPPPMMYFASGFDIISSQNYLDTEMNISSESNIPLHYSGVGFKWGYGLIPHQFEIGVSTGPNIRMYSFSEYVSLFKLSNSHVNFNLLSGIQWQKIPEQSAVVNVVLRSEMNYRIDDRLIFGIHSVFGRKENLPQIYFSGKMYFR